LQLAAIHKAIVRAIPGEPFAGAFQLFRRTHQTLLPQEVARVLLGLVLLLTAALAGKAQEQLRLGALYDWGTHAAWDPAWDKPSTGTEVLDDALEVRLKNIKPRFLALFFERRKVIRFATQEDILRFATFALPESLDPPYDGRRKVGQPAVKEPRPQWFNVRLDHFVARIIRPDGSWGEVGAFGHVERDQVRTHRTMETAWTYVLDLQALAPGDVVEVRWKYMVPYDVNGDRTAGWRGFEWMDNWARLTSWRVFFHGDLPIRHQTVSFHYHAKHGLALWSEEPFAIEEDGDQRTARWELRDLPACMSEVNARPGVDLPQIRVRLQADDHRYWTHDRLSGMPYAQPYWLYVLRMREQRALWWKRVAKKNVPDRQNKLFNEFVERTVAGLPVDRPDLRIRRLHNTIAERFSYSGDSLWYQNADLGLPRYGDQVNDGRIREISRYDLYAKLVYGVKAGYSTAYLLDGRIGSMDDHWMTPLWDNDLLMAVKAVDGTLWMHPKRGTFGEWADELPFYWAGSRALLMDPYRLVADGVNVPLFVDLPELGKADQRLREITLKVELDDPDLHGEAQVMLSGQFSTLGRAAHQGMPVDATVLPAYGDPLSEFDTGARPWTVHSSASTAPNRFHVSRDVSLRDRVQVSADSSWTVDLAALLTHAIPLGFTAADRDLPFHWDFAQDDRVVLDLRFVTPMQFDLTQVDASVVASPSAHIERSVVVVDPTHVRIESRFTVSKLMEDVSDAVALERLLNAALDDACVLRGRPLAHAAQ
jgi:hypothetical protein